LKPPNQRLQPTPVGAGSSAFAGYVLGLKPLTTRDGAANDMQDCFDFNQSPLPPRVISRETQLDFSDVNTTMP